MNQGIEREVMDIIANGYGSVPTGLDRAIASRVIEYFYRTGWMNSQDIAQLVKAAGGKIRVSRQQVEENQESFLFSYEDLLTGDIVFQNRQPDTKPDNADELVKNAKVNPDAESRTVDSGPITLRPSTPIEIGTDEPGERLGD